MNNNKTKIIVSLLSVSIVIGTIIFAVQFDVLPSELTTVSSPTTNNADSSLIGTIHIGGLLPLTGDRSTRGEDYKTAIHLAEKDFNNYLEELGAN